MMNGYAFSYNELKGCFTLNDKFEITNLIYNDVDLLHRVCLPYNLNTLSQVAAEAAFDDQAFLARTVSQNAEERTKWEALFDELGIHYYKSEANFIFFEAPDADADGLADAWLTEGYQVRRGQRDGWLRLTIPMAQDGVVMRNILKHS